MNIAVARGSLQLSNAWARSPCVAKSPTTVWTRPATLLSLSYLEEKKKNKVQCKLLLKSLSCLEDLVQVSHKVPRLV